MSAQSYSAVELNKIPWPATAEADALRRYCTPLMRDGIKRYIDNVDTDMHIVICDGVALPYTVESRGRDNAYVCAPQSQYVEYAEDELYHVESRVLRFAMRLILKPLRWICRWARFNKVVMVNNWLLSTNLYPEISETQTLGILNHLRDRYPGHAIVFRSVDMGLRQNLSTWLREAGCRMVLGRRVHIMFRNDATAWRKNSIKNDRRMKRKSTYLELGDADLVEADFERVSELYRFLYIDKYSRFNPVFSAAFLAYLWRERLWEFQAYRCDGVIDSVTATFHFNGISVGPLVGYDTAKPQKLGLYRLAYLATIDACMRQGNTNHCSAGVASYKQSRGAKSFMEHNAVYDAHLSWRRRLPWRIFQYVADKYIEPMMLRENL